MDTEKSRPATLQMDAISGERKLEQFSELLNQAFVVPSGANFLDDFPVWGGVEPGPSVLRAGVFAQAGRLAGCAAARVAKLNAPAGPIPVGIIGAVATDPLYRGRGVATETLRFLLKWLESQNVALTVLWGSEVEFYERLGFHPFGAQISLSPSEASAAWGAQSANHEIHTGWVDGIFERMRERKSGLALSAQDLAWIRAQKNVKWLWSGPAERPHAYVGFGRGIDLQGFVHEWGGESSALSQLLGALGKDHPEARVLGSPELFGKTRAELPGNSLALGMVNDPQAVLRAYGIPAEKVPAVSEDILKDARTLFGDAQSEGLPIWFWGLDSA